jgi:hypothetical protein
MVNSRFAATWRPRTEPWKVRRYALRFLNVRVTPARKSCCTSLFRRSRTRSQARPSCDPSGISAARDAASKVIHALPVSAGAGIGR